MTTMAEPEWDADTRNLALAKDSVPLCVVCGRPKNICQDSERQYDWIADPPIRCHATTAIYEKQAGFSEETNPHLHALTWPVHLKTPE